MLVSDRILQFYNSLKLDVSLPEGVEVINPYQSKEVIEVCKKFYTKYYRDTKGRRLILGINPGRFGAGLTGIPFTDPIKLETICGIKNDLPKKAELSADFIYTMINQYGGPALFYEDFYFTSVSPLGFTRAGKNLNYYDDKKLTERILPFMVDCMQRQLKFGMNTRVAFCLGEGDNYKFLSQVNDQYQFFENIIPLAHPRFIMQYKRKSLHRYVDTYITRLHQSS